MRKLNLGLLVLCLMTIFLTGASVMADDAIPVLTIDGQTENIVLDFNEAPVIRVLTPEAATALIVDAERISSGDEYNEPREWSEAYDRSRILPCNEVHGRRFYDEGIWQITARYTADDYEDGTDIYEAELDWTVIGSLEVMVNNWEAQLSAPIVSLSSTSVAKGGWLQVTVSNFQNKNEWYWYELARMNDSGEWEDWFRQTDISLKAGLAETFTVPTLDLETGTYRLWVRTEAVCYEDNGTYKTFSVYDNSSLSDGLSISAPTAAVDVPVTVGMIASGAERMQLSMTLDEDVNWWDRRDFDGDIATTTIETDRPGTYQLTLTAWEGEESRIVGTATLTATTNEYLASTVYTGFPGVLTAGQGLNGTLTLDSRTERYYIELNYCPDDGDWTTLYRVDREPINPAAETLSLPATLFTQDGRYRVHVHTRAVGIESSYNEYWFIRSTDESNSVTLEVNGGTSNITLQSSTDVHIRIIAPTATAARVLIGDQWDYRGSSDQFVFNTGFGGGDFALVAQITTDAPVWNAQDFDWSDFRWETDVNWSTCSNAVFVHVQNPNGRLDAPEVTLESSTVACDGWVRATVNSQNHGEWYWAQVRRMWWDEYGNNHWEHILDCDRNSSNSFVFPAAVLMPGDYYLTVGVDAVGWESAEKSVPFTVTQGDVDDLALYFSEDTILTSQDITFYAYAANADYMEVDVRWDKDPGWRNHYDAGGESKSWSWGCSDQGVYTFTLKAWQGGNCLGEDVVFTLTVIAPYGDLANPVTDDVPYVIETNTAVSGSFTADSHATDYGVRLIYCPDGDDWETIEDNWRHVDQENANVLSFPAEYFSTPGIYQLEIHTTATGWNGAHLNRRILVTETSMQQSLILTVNGGSDEDIYLHQNVPVTVTAPEGVTAVRLWSSSNDWWDYRANVEGGLEWYWGFHNGGDETLFAQATTDASVMEWLADPTHDGMRDFDWSQVSWTMISNEVAVHVIHYGNLDNPQVEFPNGTTIARGEILQVAVERVDNAYGFGVQVRRADDDEWHWLMDMEYTFEDSNTVLIPTDSLEAGDYMMHIDPRRYGWHGDSVGYPFTVTQDEAWTNEAVFRVNPDEIMTREYITYSVYAPGAAEVMVCNENIDFEWMREQGESLVGRVMLNWAKVYHLKAYAYYPGEEDEGEWLQVAQTAEINVTAPNGVMGLTVEAPSRKKTTDSWTISLLCDFKGTDGEAECFLTSDVYGKEYELELIDGPSAEGNCYRFTYQVDANTLEIGPYRITAYAFPGTIGYEIGVFEGIVDIADGSIEATLAANPTTVEIFDDVELSLFAPGATAVALYSDWNGMGWIYNAGDTLYESQTAWWDGEAFFYGKYTTEEIDPDEDSFSWDNIHWEGMSNTVLVTINPPSAELEELDVVLESATVKRGEKLKLTIRNENPGLDVNYGAHLLRAEDGDYGPGYTWFGPGPDDDRIIWIETLEVPAGEYRLQVSANARSCHPVNTWIPVTITQADDGLKLTVQDQNVITGSTIQAVGYANGAVHVRLDVYFEHETWESDTFETDGDCLNAEVFTGEHPDTIVLNLTVTYENGTTETLRKTVTVTAPKGLLHPAIILNSAWQPGQDLSFTVDVGTAEAQYVVFVQEPNAGEAVFAQFVPSGTSSVRQFVLSKDEYDFEAGKTYEIRVIAAGTGYNGNETYLLITRKTSLMTLTLPNNLKTIEEEAFAGVAAEKIVIPSGVTTIGSNAFTGCSNLIELVLPAGITSFAADALGTSGPVFVYGQAGSYLEDYANTINNLCFIPIN